MSKKNDQIGVRLEKELKEWVKGVAEDQHRTLSQQVTWIISEFRRENKKG